VNYGVYFHKTHNSFSERWSHGVFNTQDKAGRYSFTFGVVSGVELKQFDRVLWETVDVDPVLQDDDDPEEETQGHHVGHYCYGCSSLLLWL